MNKALRVSLVAILTLVFFGTSSAQKVKLAHVNTMELMQQLIVKDSVEKQLERLQREMQMDLQKKQMELNKSYQEYLGAKDTLSKIMLKMREEALREQQQQLEVLPQQYEQAFQSTQNELIEPIRIKVEAAIEKVSKAGEYTYVFDSSALLYSGGGLDITDLVRTELGLPKPDPNAPKPTSNLLVPGQ